MICLQDIWYGFLIMKKLKKKSLIKRISDALNFIYFPHTHLSFRYPETSMWN